MPNTSCERFKGKQTAQYYTTESRFPCQNLLSHQAFSCGIFQRWIFVPLDMNRTARWAFDHMNKGSIGSAPADVPWWILTAFLLPTERKILLFPSFLEERECVCGRLTGLSSSWGAVIPKPLIDKDYKTGNDREEGSGNDMSNRLKLQLFTESLVLKPCVTGNVVLLKTM